MGQPSQGHLWLQRAGFPRLGYNSRVISIQKTWAVREPQMFHSTCPLQQGWVHIIVWVDPHMSGHRELQRSGVSLSKFTLMRGLLSYERRDKVNDESTSL